MRGDGENCETRFEREVEEVRCIQLPTTQVEAMTCLRPPLIDASLQAFSCHVPVHGWSCVDQDIKVRNFSLIFVIDRQNAKVSVR